MAGNIFRVASRVSNIIDYNLFDHIIDQLSTLCCFIDQLSNNYQHKKNKREIGAKYFQDKNT